jgi:hypothetical protein
MVIETGQSATHPAINDEMIRDAAQVLHRLLCAKVAKPALWDRLRPSTRKQYLDIAYAMLKAAALKRK